jgi:hypothetical protein
VGTSANGTGTGADASFTTQANPPSPPAKISVKTLRLTPKAFLAASSGPTVKAAKASVGTIVRFALSGSGSTRFTVQRALPGRRSGKRCVRPRKQNAKAKHCTRWSTVGSFTRTGATASKKFRFTGRLKGHRLKPGAYRLVAVATNSAGVKGPQKTASFRILAPPRRK